MQKYVRRVREPGEQAWLTFLANHSDEIRACDFLQLYDVLFRPIVALFFVKHGSCEVVHLNVTRSPSDAWAAQQFREATPYGAAPRYLIRDNGCKYGPQFAAVTEGAVIARPILGGLHHDCRRAACSPENVRTAGVGSTATSETWIASNARQRTNT